MAEKAVGIERAGADLICVSNTPVSRGRCLHSTSQNPFTSVEGNVSRHRRSAAPRGCGRCDLELYRDPPLIAQDDRPDMAMFNTMALHVEGAVRLVLADCKRCDFGIWLKSLFLGQANRGRRTAELPASTLLTCPTLEPWVSSIEFTHASSGWKIWKVHFAPLTMRSPDLRRLHLLHPGSILRRALCS